MLSGEWPDVEVNTRVFIGLTNHPSDLPRVLKWSQRNSRSSRARGAQAKTLSTKLRRCVMPPAPSSPGLLLLSRWVAWARRSLSSGLRRHNTTRDIVLGTHVLLLLLMLFKNFCKFLLPVGSSVSVHNTHIEYGRSAKLPEPMAAGIPPFLSGGR